MSLHASDKIHLSHCFPCHPLVLSGCADMLMPVPLAESPSSPRHGVHKKHRRWSMAPHILRTAPALGSLHQSKAQRFLKRRCRRHTLLHDLNKQLGDIWAKNHSGIYCTRSTRGRCRISIIILSSGAPPSSYPFSFSSNASPLAGRGPGMLAPSRPSSTLGYHPSHVNQPQARVQSFNNGQSRTYHLHIVQQPSIGAEFGNALLSRLPIAPPLIVQVIVRDTYGQTVLPDTELPFLIGHLSLFSADGRPLDMDSAPGDGRPARRLLNGNLVSSAMRLRDSQGRQGVFLVYPDVSIRYRGHYSLGVTLMRISGAETSLNAVVANIVPSLAETRTLPFEIVPHQNYVAPGLTRLTQSFARQGAPMYTSNNVGPY